jgi:hypothetical protein
VFLGVSVERGMPLGVCAEVGVHRGMTALPARRLQ